ncbi:hypothetical protein ACFVBP_10690 [Nocardioides sp. NPDC057764]|uniref:hypothetical protein n=1 Tax=Nocardioides sp. NPDC057764 TaxID=3346243 RepID=UPI00366C4518
MPEPASPHLMVGDAWDVWWACTRAGLSASELGIDLRLDDGVRSTDPDPGEGPDPRQGSVVVLAECGRCIAAVRDLTRRAPNDTTDPDRWSRCGCPARWARRMREHDQARPDQDRSERTDPSAAWRLSIGVVKPGADVDAVHELLSSQFQIIAALQRMLSDRDVHRLYPEAYGPAFRRRQNDYLTSGPVHALVLVAPARLTIRQHQAAKMAVRKALGGTDDLRNYLHMADNPAEAWCDAQHLLGPTAAQLYERYGA